MLMSRIWVLFLTVSLLCASLTGSGAALTGAVAQGAREGIGLAFSLAGALCLWSGVGRVMTDAGISDALAGLLRPLLRRLFPGTGSDPALARDISTNVCANLLGLGNAATPPGIRALRRMAPGPVPGTATAEMCRFVILNTASVQLLPTNVAALRSTLGCETPFDILLPVWITSLCSVCAGLSAAALFGRMWKQ